MRVTESIFIKGYTSLSLSEKRQFSNWTRLLIDGVEYDTVPIMDAGDDCIAIVGNHDLTGKEVTFI